jgi:hypothetical protein
VYTSLGNIFEDLFTFGDTGTLVRPDWMVARRDEANYLAWVGKVNSGTDPITFTQSEVNSVLGELAYWASRVGEVAQYTNSPRPDLTSTRNVRAVNFIVDASKNDPMSMSNSTARAITNLIGTDKDLVAASVRAANQAGSTSALPRVLQTLNPDTVQHPESNSPWGLIAGVGGAVAGAGLIGFVLWRILRKKRRRR